MHKLTVLYKHPLGETAFEKYYCKIHLPPAAKIPNVDHAELYFVTEELMMQSLATPEGQAEADDIPKFATGGFHFLTGKILGHSCCIINLNAKM